MIFKRTILRVEKMASGRLGEAVHLERPKNWVEQVLESCCIVWLEKTVFVFTPKAMASHYYVPFKCFRRQKMFKRQRISRSKKQHYVDVFQNDNFTLLVSSPTQNARSLLNGFQEPLIEQP